MIRILPSLVSRGLSFIICFPGEEVDQHLAQAEEIEERIMKKTAEAYKRASSQADADEESEYLRRMRVLLPNGFTPLPPLFSEAGEELLKMFPS